MSQAGFDAYAGTVRDGGFILYDPLFVKPTAAPAPAHAVAMTEIADRVGKRVVANIVAVGALARLMGFFEMDRLEQALLARVPTGTEELNRRALRAGYDSVAN
jgi:2-oxoglutarate ferredoxin oxidoreductase subunit gamma